jgi:MFS family permease
LRGQLADLGLVLRTDRPFRRFLGGLSWQAFGMMGNSFLVVYAVQRLAAPDDLVAWYTAVLLAGQMSSTLAFGWLADRRGFSAVGQASSYALAGLSALALVVPSAGWLLPAFFLLGACQSGSMLARFAGAMDFAPADRRPSYVVLANALVSLSAAAAPLFGGQVVALFGYSWLYILSLGCAIVAAVVLGNAPRPTRGHPT